MDLLLEGGDSVLLKRDFGLKFATLPQAVVIERDQDNDIVCVQILEGTFFLFCFTGNTIHLHEGRNVPKCFSGVRFKPVLDYSIFLFSIEIFKKCTQ